MSLLRQEARDIFITFWKKESIQLRPAFLIEFLINLLGGEKHRLRI
jgi:hypothetical protein